MQKLLILLAVWSVLLVTMLVYEHSFVSSQQAFLKEREFHTLGRLAEELNSQIQRAQLSTQSFVQLAAGQDKQDDQILDDFLRLYLPGVWTGKDYISAHSAAINAAKQCQGSPVALQADLRNLVLAVSCRVAQPSAKPKKIYTLDLAPWIETSFHPLGGDLDDVFVADETGNILYQQSATSPRITNLNRLVPMNAAGDSTTASTESQVAAETAKPGSGQKDAEAGGSPRATSSGAGQDSAVRHVLVGTSFFTTTTLGGQDYQMFSVPVPIHLKNLDEEKSLILVVSGLRLKESFEADSRAIPYPTLIWATLITVAVFTLSWPFAKLRYMSTTERFTSRDAWLLVLTTFLAAASITLMLLNANYTSLSRQRTDETLKRLAARIKKNFQAEMQLASQQMRVLDQQHELPQKMESKPIIPRYLAVAEPWPLVYPYFDIAAWVDHAGMQVSKLDPRRAPTPLVNIRQLPFFSKVMSDATWDEPDDAAPKSLGASPAVLLKHYYMDPEISLTTAQFAPVLAVARSLHHEPALFIMAVRPMSLVDPVLPPGYGFAVIDADCNVLFHSDSFRDRKENFCQESKGRDELRPWLFGGDDSPINISYAGRPERAFFSAFSSPEVAATTDTLQFAVGQVYLVVFRVPDHEMTLNLAIILVFGILFGFYFLILASAVILAAWLPKSTHTIRLSQLIWPSAQDGEKYLQIAAANVVLLLSFWFLSSYIYEFPLLVLCIVIGSLSVLFPVLKLTGREKLLRRVGVILILVSTAAPVVGLWLGALDDWRYVFVSTAVAGATSALLGGYSRLARARLPLSSRIPARLAAYGRRNFDTAYILVSITVIAGICVIPCIGCFKFAYDAVSEVALKHDEIVVSNALLARRDRIHQYFDQFRPPKISTRSNELQAAGEEDEEERIDTSAKKRLDLGFDRYDVPGEDEIDASATKPFNQRCNRDDVVSEFTYNCAQERGLGLGQAGDIGQCQPDSPQLPDPNAWIERIIARAVLLYPTNQLGSEMSKLGVASSESSTAGGEHYFDEEEATCFRLVWKPWSRLPRLSVVGTYPPWHGFQWWGNLLIVVLGLLLGLWLARVVRRIFLTDVRKLRSFPVAAWKQASDIQGHFIVLGLPKSGKSQWLRSLPGISRPDFFDLGIELKRMVKGGTFPETSGDGNVVVLDSFEFNLKDPVYNEARLNVLEYLVFESSCWVVLVSGVDPLYYLKESGPEVLSDPPNPEFANRLRDRWARVLSRFEKVQPRLESDHDFTARISQFSGANPNHIEFAAAVSQECKWTPALRRIGIDLLNEFDGSNPVSPASVENGVFDLAGEYYQVLWSGLTPNERLALYQLAVDGWANPKNTRVLQQLESKVLIRRDPMYKVVNQSLRRFVASSDRAKEMEQWQAQQQQSTWRVLRLFLVGIVIVGAAWLLHSQAAFSQQLAALIAGVATLLTAASALFSRASKSAASK